MKSLYRRARLTVTLVTLTTALCATALYHSPNLAHAGAVTFAADVCAAGVSFVVCERGWGRVGGAR